MEFLQKRNSKRQKILIEMLKKRKKETKLKVKRTDVKPSDIKVNIATKPNSNLPDKQR